MEIRVKVFHYDVFTTTPGKGNPAGVVLNSDALSTEQMQLIAAQTGFTETTFVSRLNESVPRFRYFSPKSEMNLCGHGTIAAWTALQEQNFNSERNQLIETKIGRLNIGEVRTPKGIQVQMQQGVAQFSPFESDLIPVLESIGIKLEQVDKRFPIVYGSTGNWTLILPVKRLKDFLDMQPDNKQFSSVLKQFPEASIHPICLETYLAEADMHGRHFSATQSGTKEDPVTGTASGVMGAYYAKYINPQSWERHIFRVEQGHEMEREGLVEVTVNYIAKNWEVMIAGVCVRTTSRILII